MKLLKKLFPNNTNLSDSVFYRVGALGDITAYDPQGVFAKGTKAYLVSKVWTTTINPGEPVAKTDYPTNYVVGLPSSAPVFGATVTAANPASTTVVGIAATASNQTTTNDGTITVWPIDNGTIWLGNPTATQTFFGATAVPSQTLYNTLVGQAVVFQSAGGIFTINGTHAAGNGCIIEYIDITKYPGKVAFSFRPTASIT